MKLTPDASGVLHDFTRDQLVDAQKQFDVELTNFMSYEAVLKAGSNSTTTSSASAPASSTATKSKTSS